MEMKEEVEIMSFWTSESWFQQKKIVRYSAIYVPGIWYLMGFFLIHVIVAWVVSIVSTDREPGTDYSYRRFQTGISEIPFNIMILEIIFSYSTACLKIAETPQASLLQFLIQLNLLSGAFLANNTVSKAFLTFRCTAFLQFCYTFWCTFFSVVRPGTWCKSILRGRLEKEKKWGL